jgi:hypothetical protein
MTKKFSQLTAISNVGDTPANVIFGISNTASGTSNTISLLSLTTHLDSTFATDVASLANVGAGLITVTSAYQANTGAAALAGQANVGAGRIADVASGQANVGASIIAVTSGYQANTGAAALAGQANVGVEIAARAANVGASVIILTNNINNAFNQANSAYTAANTALNISQNIQIQDYTLQLTDRGKHIYSTNTQVQTITIPNSGVVAWPTGTVIDIVLNGSGMINVATSNDVTLYVANNSTIKGYANVYPRGWATLLYVSGNTWYIKGQGVD